MTEKNDIFVKHIGNHLAELMMEYGEPMEVICKICGKTIDEIYEGEKP